MKRLLHIVATPRGEESRTLRVTEAFLEAFRRRPDGWAVEELDLSKEELPRLTIKRVDGKYALLGGEELGGELKKAWGEIVKHIERFLAADAYLISAPMWNFHIPYMLKQYIDIIVQPKYLFRYTAAGVEGLVKNKKMLVITSRGGDYSPGGANSAYDFQEPYLRSIFAFVGFNDIRFINAQPMDMGPGRQRERLEEAKKAALLAANEF